MTGGVQNILLQASHQGYLSSVVGIDNEARIRIDDLQFNAFFEGNQSVGAGNYEKTCSRVK